MPISLKLLLISADPALLDGLRAAVALLGPQAAALACGSAEEAALADPPPEPELIVLDGRVPAVVAQQVAVLRRMHTCADVPLALAGASELAHGAIATLPAGADAPALAAELTALWRRHQSRQLEQFIRQLAAEYILELPELWQQIARGWAGLQREWRADECEQMRRLVHTMRGASASLNLAPLNAAARALDQALALTTAVPPAAEQVAELDLAFEQLRRAIAALA